MFDCALTIRVAGPGDSRVLELLGRSGRRSEPPAGKALLAERNGVPVAAIGLTTGSTLTDPFQPTRDAERLLKLTRYGILRQGGQIGAARALLKRAQTGNHQVPRRPRVGIVETGSAGLADGHERPRPRMPRGSARTGARRHPVTGRAGSELLALEERRRLQQDPSAVNAQSRTHSKKTRKASRTCNQP
jgi:hypothetical protein